MQKLIWKLMNRNKLSYAFWLRNKEIAEPAFVYLLSNGMVGVKDRLYYYGTLNLALWHAVSALINIKKVLSHLAKLATKNALVRKELPYFQYHTYYMRGLYALEHGQPEEALSQWKRAIGTRPFQWNAYYLLVKSYWKKLLK